MKPKRTPELEARLDEIARLKASIPTFKELEEETGLTANWLSQVISQKIRVMTLTNNLAVSHETNSDTLSLGPSP